MSLLSNAPYHDKYDHSKQYTQLLAVPGRVAQARELTEIQSTMKDIIKSLGDSMMKDGNIIEGCQVIPDKERKRVTVTSGRVYMNGMVLSLPESSVDITASGPEIIGVKLKETIITYTDDPSLRDPALGYENYNQPGCDRLKSEVEVVRVTETSDSVAVLASLFNGELTTEQQAPNYSALNDTLARRTYDESGSYIVDGLKVRVENILNDPNSFNVVVEPGKAYVHGYELTIPSARRIKMPRSTTSVNVNPRYNYSSGATYLLTTGPYTKAINNVNGSLETTESVTINSSQGAALSYNSAYKILRVTKDGQNIAASSYRLEQGPTSYIRWNDTTYPGDNVVVTYYYTIDFVKDRDYELYLDSNNNHYLRWKETSPLTPVEGESLLISYEKYLARKDTTYIDQYGNISVLKGIPADYGFEIAPDAPAYTLALAAVMSPPGGTVDQRDDYRNINVTNVGLTRFTMSDIHSILKRIRTLEYDQTVLSLNNEAKEYGTDDKRGIFTDAFIDFSKLGMYFNLNDAGEKIYADRPIYDVAIDLRTNSIVLPLDVSFMDITQDKIHSTGTNYGRTVTLKKKGERTVLLQDKATKSYMIAPYVVAMQTPEILITPSIDTWINEDYIDIPESISTSRIVSTSASHFTGASEYAPGWHDNSTLFYNNIQTSDSYTNVGTEDGGTTYTIGEMISEEASTYLRSREVEVHGTHYAGNLDNIRCYIEDIEVPLTPIGTTQSGTVAGSVRSDRNGEFKAKFTIPEGTILSGTRVVKLESDVSVAGYEGSAFAFYQGIGSTQTYRRTVTTTTIVLQHRTTNITTNKVYYDPLAQTFVLDQLTILNGVDIYFENVPDNNTPVTCEIREVNDGNIKSTIYGFKTLNADDIRSNTSNDGSIATRFNFNDPVLIEPNREYAIVLRSTSQEYRVYVAEIGEPDVVTGETVISNPYLQGVMMSSSNNSSWTVHQKTDMKFRLVADTYEDSSEIIFNELSNPKGFCNFVLAANALVFNNTSLEWFYSIDGGTSYNILPDYNTQRIDLLADHIKVKARLRKTSDTNLTPILALDSVSMSMSCYQNDGDKYYVSNQITGLDEYNTVEFILDTKEPLGTQLNVFVSPSLNNATKYIMKSATQIDSRELRDGWTEKTYRVTLDSPATLCRIFIKMNSDTKYRTPTFRKLRAIMS